MAPPAEKDTSQADADFLFHVLTAIDELKINWKTVASAAGISAYNNANRKFHVLVEKRGFKFKDGKIMTKEAAEIASAAAKIATPGKKSAGKKKAPTEDYDTTADPTTPSKPPAKKARSKAIPKKRKIEETAGAEDEDSNAVGETSINEKDGIEVGEREGVKVDGGPAKLS